MAGVEPDVELEFETHVVESSVNGRGDPRLTNGMALVAAVELNPELPPQGLKVHVVTQSESENLLDHKRSRPEEQEKPEPTTLLQQAVQHEPTSEVSSFPTKKSKQEHSSNNQLDAFHVVNDQEHPLTARQAGEKRKLDQIQCNEHPTIDDDEFSESKDKDKDKDKSNNSNNSDSNNEDNAAYATPKKKMKQEEAMENEIDAFLKPEYEEVGLTRSGRKITKRKTFNSTPKKQATPAKKAEKKPLESDFCSVCGEMEDDALSEFVLCDGGCLGSFHLSCLGLENAPEETPWLCEDCRTNETTCFICNRVGTIGERGGVYRCSVPACGKAYHQACIDADPLAMRLQRRATKNDSGPQEMEEVTDLSVEEQKRMERERLPFRCSIHVCHVCEDSKRGGEFMHCMKCPRTYHAGCVAPSCRFNNLSLLCAKHPDDALRKIPHWMAADQSTEIVTVVDPRGLRLPLLFVPRNEPKDSKASDVHHFRLPVDYMEDLEKHPPVYRKLVKNIYTFKPPKVDLEDQPLCVCKDHCGDQCINRLSFTECFGPAPVPGAKWSKDLKDSNCNLGEHCGNRALHQRIYPKFQRFHTREKGWALRVLENVKASTLVIEYVGEVINEEEKERRLMEHAKTNPDDKNMYIMELGKGTYIDARFKGSESRFINHSCDPNCHLLKWSVKGVDRIAITALRDIQAGEELSYDYQFHTRQALEWKCFCNSKNCRGTMAPEKINQRQQAEEAARKASTKKLSKKELLIRDKRKIVQQRMQEHKEAKASLKRLSLTTQVSLGDFANSTLKSNVRVGPASRDLSLARASSVFLPRNARVGSDFLMRKHLRKRRLRKRYKTQVFVTHVLKSFDEASVSSSSRLEEESDVEMVDTSSVETVETCTSSQEQMDNNDTPIGTRDAPIELEDSDAEAELKLRSQPIKDETKFEAAEQCSSKGESKGKAESPVATKLLAEETNDLEFDMDERSIKHKATAQASDERRATPKGSHVEEQEEEQDDDDDEGVQVQEVRVEKKQKHKKKQMKKQKQKEAVDADAEVANDLEFEMEETQDVEFEMDETQDVEFEMDETQDVEFEVEETEDVEFEVEETEDVEFVTQSPASCSANHRGKCTHAAHETESGSRDVLVVMNAENCPQNQNVATSKRQSRQSWPRMAKSFLKRAGIRPNPEQEPQQLQLLAQQQLEQVKETTTAASAAAVTATTHSHEETKSESDATEDVRSNRRPRQSFPRFAKLSTKRDDAQQLQTPPAQVQLVQQSVGSCVEAFSDKTSKESNDQASISSPDLEFDMGEEDV